MRCFPLLAGAALLAAPAAAADRVSPTIALPLAALVGARDPALPAADERTLTALADGDGAPGASGRPKIAVAAQAIVCRASNVAIAERACELSFGARKVTITGLRAHELAATLQEAGAQPEGAAGSIYVAVSRLRCSVSPAEVRENAGAGAGCDFEPAK